MEEIKLGEEQIQALDKIKDFVKGAESVFSLQGAGGTGKSLLLSYIIKYLDSIGKRYCLCAPTHKAKTVMQNYSGMSALTLHKLLSLSPKLDIQYLDMNDLKFYSKNCEEIPYNGIVICDEASMINDDLYKFLVEKCQLMESKILFMSDSKQLQPVKSDTLSLVYSVPNQFRLTKIYRQNEDSALAPILEELRNNSISHFDTSLGMEGGLECISNFKEFFSRAESFAKESIDKKDIFYSKILAYTNNRVNSYNEYISKSIFGDSSIFHKGEILTCCENLGEEFYNASDYIIVDDPIKRDIEIPEIGIFDGYEIRVYDEGDKDVKAFIILSKNLSMTDYTNIAMAIECIRQEAVNCKNKKVRGKMWGRYYNIMGSFTSPVDLYYDNRLIRKKSFDRGYATTVHRSQGSSYNNVFVDMDNINICKEDEIKRQLQYVALSRTRGDAIIYQS